MKNIVIIENISIKNLNTKIRKNMKKVVILTKNIVEVLGIQILVNINTMILMKKNTGIKKIDLEVGQIVAAV